MYVNYNIAAGKINTNKSKYYDCTGFGETEQEQDTK